MKLMEMAKLRAWWAHRQGLDGSLAGLDSGAVLARTGWARSVGGSNPYLTLFARGGLTRETVDRDVAEVRICELPSARGCTYVLPAEDFGLGLAAAKPYVVNGDMATGAKLGVTPDEIERLCDGIAAVLGGVPLDPKEIKTAVGSLVRDLGPEGVKRGLATTFPLAMRLLQWSGRARRVAVNGRLDTQRWTARHPALRLRPVVAGTFVRRTVADDRSRAPVLSVDRTGFGRPLSLVLGSRRRRGQGRPGTLEPGRCL